MPHLFHPDEAVEVFRALQLGAGHFDFGRVMKGGYYLLLFGAFGVYFAALFALGEVSGPREFGLFFAQDPTAFWLIGRFLTVLFGTATLVLVYWIGRRAWGATAALWGVAVLALTRVHVELSHYITLDVPESFFLAAAFLAILHFAQSGSRRAMVVGILLVAVGAAFKVPGGALGFPWFAAVLYRLRVEGARGRLLTHAGLALAAGLAFYVLMAPGILQYVGLAEFDSARVGSRREARDLRIVQLGGVRSVEGWLLYPRYLFNDYGRWWGVPLLALNLAAVIRCAWRRAVPDVLFLTFWVTTVLAFFFFVPLAAGRYLLPNLVLGAPFVGALIVETLALAGRPGRSRLLRPAVLTVALAALVLAGGYSAAWVGWRSRPDTRELALEWMREHVPLGAHVVLTGNRSFPDTGTIPIPVARGHIQAQIVGYRRVGDENKAEYLEQYYLPSLPDSGYVPVLVSGGDSQELEAYLASGVDVFVVEDPAVARVHSETGRRAFPALAGLYDDLRNEAEGVRLAARFEPSFPGRPGPAISIYRASESPVSAPARAEPPPATHAQPAEAGAPR